MPDADYEKAKRDVEEIAPETEGFCTVCGHHDGEHDPSWHAPDATGRRPDDTGQRLRNIVEVWASPPPEVLAKLPKGGVKGRDKILCNVCGGWHLPNATHLDYMGHADVTKVLIGIDPFWNWAPLGVDPDGLPVVRVTKGTASLWIALTVLGKTVIGVGTCDAEKDEVLKELVGDAIRNAAMRFGIALDLWSKAERMKDHAPERQAPERSRTAAPPERRDEERRTKLNERLDALPADYAERVMTRMTERAEVPVGSLDDLPDGWLDYWERMIRLAETAAEAGT